MTQAELDAIPDGSPGFGQRIEMRDGQEIRIPVYQDGVGVLFHKDGDDAISVIDVLGVRWMLGWVGETRYKVRCSW